MVGEQSLLATKHYSSWSPIHISTLLKEISQEDPDLQKHPESTHPYGDPHWSFCLLHFHDKERETAKTLCKTMLMIIQYTTAAKRASCISSVSINAMIFVYVPRDADSMQVLNVIRSSPAN